MNYENQRFDFDIWGRVYRKEIDHGAPRLQPNPLAEMIRLHGKRSAEPVTYEQRDPNELSREEIDAVYLTIDAVMARIEETDWEAYTCLMARHAKAFTDARGVQWQSVGMPERMIAKAIFRGSAETAKTRFRRACERGYASYQRLAVAI